MSEYPDLSNCTRESLLLLIANAPLHSEDDDFVYCPWGCRVTRDANGTRLPKDAPQYHAPGCPVLQARALLPGDLCKVCDEWIPKAASRKGCLGSKTMAHVFYGETQRQS